MKKLFIINGINSELAQHYLKKIINKNFIIGLNRSKYQGIRSKNLLLINELKINRRINYILDKYKKIIFINFAASRDDELIINLNEKKINEVINSNVISSIKILKKILPSMIKNNYGRIIFLSSKKAENGSKGNIVYAFSKVGLQGVSKTINKEYSKFNISSNIISLGYFNTKMWKSLKKNTRDDLLKNTLHQKLGNPKVLIDVISLIIKHAFIIDSKLDIDGGIS